MAQNPLGINQGTNAFINFDQQGTVNTQVVNVGTIGGNLPGGTVNLVSAVGTIGTVGLATVSGNVGVSSGTINVSTISTLPNIPGGTVGLVSAVGTIGTIGLATVTGNVGVSSGTINVSTISSLPNTPGGTLGLVSAIGTLGTVGLATVTGNLGTIGTIGLATVSGNVGVSSGTLNTGTLSPIPTIANVTFGTHGTTGASIFGTLAGGTGSGAGTEIFITSLSLTIPSTGGSQDVSIGWGTNGGTFHNGTGLLVRGNFPPGGGIQKQFWPPSNSGTNAQLCLFQAGAGTVDVSVTYFITPSAL